MPAGRHEQPPLPCLPRGVLPERAHQQDAEAEFVGQRQDGPQFRWGDEASRLVTPGTGAISRVAGALPDGSSREPPSLP